MSKSLYVLKIGGKVLEDKATLQVVIQAFLALPGDKILVHGGGKQASILGQQLGIPPKMYQGRRITDEATLEIVTMVYAGLYNKQLVAQLQANGCNAIGLSGADGNTIKAHKRQVKEIDYGFAGDIDHVDAEGVDRLLNAGFTPVFCAITHNKQGQLLNTNADTIASTVAQSMAAFYSVNLLYCFEKEGVLLDPEDEQSVISHLNTSQYQSYCKTGVISGGMLPKLDNAFAALNAGVLSVRIAGPGNLQKGGTLLSV